MVLLDGFFCRPRLSLSSNSGTYRYSKLTHSGSGISMLRTEPLSYMTRCFLQSRIARHQIRMNVEKIENRFIIATNGFCIRVSVCVCVWNRFDTLQNQQQICINIKNFNGFYSGVHVVC